VAEAARHASRHRHLEENPRYALRYHTVRQTVPGTVAYSAHWNQKLLELLPDDPSKSVLDLMCGDGIFLPALVGRYRRVAGLDMSMPLLELAPRRVRMHLVCGDALVLPFAADTFDVVVVRGALHHLPHSLDVLFAELRRIMTPGGAFVLLEPSDDNPLLRGFRRYVYRTLAHFAEHERGLTTRELRIGLEREGFRVITVRRSGFLAYAVLLNTDAHWLLRAISNAPGAATLARWLIAFDSCWERLPLFGRLTFNVFLSARLEAS
jgi:ubiquinone/menaquinone biosynthesis C-methylase UbiE